MENYEHLEGLQVLFNTPVNEWGYEEEYMLPCIVVGVERDIGITVVRADDKDCKIYCLNRKLHYDKGNYDACFDKVVEGLEAGILDFLETEKAFYNYKMPDSGPWGSVTCAFL